MPYTPEQLETRRARARKWNAEHKDRVSQNQRLYYLRNAEMVRRKRSDYSKAHRDANRLRRIAWVQKYPWYDSWQAAKQRCLNPTNPRYARYGGIGIAFSLSKADAAFLWVRDNAVAMASPTIDRRDNNGPYSLDNCAFIEKVANSKKSWIDRLPKLPPPDSPLPF